MARTGRLRGAFPYDSHLPAVCCRSSVVEHSLGKGEVHSSILCGSTIGSQSRLLLILMRNQNLRSWRFLFSFVLVLPIAGCFPLHSDSAWTFNETKDRFTDEVAFHLHNKSKDSNF